MNYLYPYVIAMLGGLKIKIGKTKEGIEIIRQVESIGNGLPRLQYNLACSYSLWAETETGVKKEDLLNTSLEYLRKSFWLGENIARIARKGDRSLACVSSERTKEFNEIIALPVSLPKPFKRYELETLTSIDRTLATKLSQEKLNSVSDFLLATRTPAQRDSLADTLQIGSEQVKEWALAMELASVRGVELADVNLLNAANVRCLEDLQRSDPVKLRLDLIDWARTKKLKKVPNDSAIQLWIYEALQSPPFVQI